MAGVLEGSSMAGKRNYEEGRMEERNPAKRHRSESHISSNEQDKDNCSQVNDEAQPKLTSDEKLRLEADLFAAISKQQLELIKSCIELGAPVNSVDPKLGETPLTLMCKQVPNTQPRKLIHFEIINLLLENGASVNQKNFKDQTPLHLATSSEVVKVLVEKGASLEEMDRNFETPLVFACKRFKRSVDVITALLEAGACINGACINGAHSPLHVASYPATKLLLEKGANVNQVDSIGRSALFVHSGKPNGLDAINTLLEHGASINLKDCSGRTPLHVACQRAFNSTVELLLQKGASVNETDKYGGTPLFIAAKKPICTDDTISLLLAHGASINLPNLKGKTPLHVCLYSATILIKNGATLDALDNARETPLFTACRRQSHDDGLLLALLQHNASVNVKNEEGETPLHVACSFPNVDFVTLLLRHGADVNEVNKKQESPLFAFREKTYFSEKLMDLLLDAGADIDLKNCKGQTLLHVACSRGETNLVKLLLRKGALVNGLDNEQASPLLIALRNGFYNNELLIALLENGASVNVQDVEGDSLLHIVCKKTMQSMSQMLNEQGVLVANLLLQKGAIVNCVNSEDKTPLQIACSSYSSCPVLVRCLLEYGASVNCRNGFGETPLHVASRVLYQRDEDVYLALLQHGASVNATNYEGFTPLALAPPMSSALLLHYGASHCSGLSCLKPRCCFSRVHPTISEFIDLIQMPPANLDTKIGQTNVTYYNLLCKRVPRSNFEEVLSVVTPQLLKSISCNLCELDEACARCRQFQNMVYCSYLKIKNLKQMDDCSCVFTFTTLPFLPPEVVCKIFSYLDFDDLNSLHQVVNPVPKR